MKMKTNPAMGGGANASKKLLAAVAVLAVAFVVLAAIPAVDADDAVTTPGNGTIKLMVDGAQKGSDFTDMKTALEVANAVDSSKSVILFCESGKLINFTSSHIPLLRSMTIEGNGAFAYGSDKSTAGELIQIEMNGQNLSAKTDLVINNLHNVSVWGSRATDYEFNLQMNGCKLGTSDLPLQSTGAAVLITGDRNCITNIELNNCEFGPNASYCTVYSNYNGVITINNCSFDGIREPININSKMTDADVEIIVENSSFTDCGVGNDSDSKYAAPIRVVNSKSTAASTSLTVTDCSFNYSSGKSSSNGDILIGEGRALDGSEQRTSYDVDVSISGTKTDANIQWQTPGYQTDKTANAGKATIINASKNSAVSADGKDITLKSGSIVVPEGETLGVMDNASLTIDKNATLTVVGAVTGTIDNKGTVEALNGGNLNGATITGSGKVTSRIDDTGKENVNIDGIIKGESNTYDADQIVTIVGNTEIQKGAKLTISGILVIKEGVTLTLEAGSKLVLSSGAVMDIQGTLVIEQTYGEESSGSGDYAPSAIFEIAKGTVNVYGTVDASGKFYVNDGTVNVQQDGVLNILEEGELGIVAGTQNKVVVMDSGAMSVYGSVVQIIKNDSGDGYTSAYGGVAYFENSGSIVFDSRVVSESIDVTMKNGAALDIKNVTLPNEKSITVKDGKSTVTIGAAVTPAPASDSGTTARSSGDLADAVVSGISFAETATINKSDEGKSVYVLSIFGSIAVAPITSGDDTTDKATATVTLMGFATTTAAKSKLTITEGLIIGENVTLDNRGTLEVTVLVDATKGAVRNTSTATSEGVFAAVVKIAVSGDGTIIANKNGIANGDGAVINASKYETGTGDDKRVYYVTLDNALAAASVGTTKRIDVLGEQTLTESAELVAGATLNVKAGAKITIGSGDNESEDVLTVKSGAIFTGESSFTGESFVIDVKGTVFAEKKTDIKVNAKDALNDGAAVYSEEIDERNRPVSSGWAKWTNVYTAMADSTLTVVKLINGITLDKNLTIPEGKTLDTNEKIVRALKNVVITVEGTLDIGSPSKILLEKPEAADTAGKTASIVVKGLIQSDADIANNSIMEVEHTTPASIDGTAITLLGAYYIIDSVNYMTTVEKAATIISTVDEQTIQIKGESTDKLTVAGDIAFVGTDDTAAIDVQISEIVFSGSVALDNATISFVTGAVVSGTFANGSGSVDFKGAVSGGMAILFKTNDGTAVLTVTGGLANDTEVDTDSRVLNVVGSVSFGEFDVDEMTVAGIATIGNGKDVNRVAVDILIVNGSIIVTNAATLDAEDAEVMGSVVVNEKATASSTEGSFDVGELYIGIDGGSIYEDDSYTVGAAASVTGNVAIDDDGFVVAAAGATVPESFTAEDAQVKSTAYYVDNGLYITVYVNKTSNAIEIGEFTVEKENAYFSAWKNDNGEDATEKVVGTGDFTKVTADFVTKIFSVVVYADTAVDNLYIDGNLMLKGLDGSFSTDGVDLVAGAHTFSYTLKNGYTGTGTFKIIAQKVVDGFDETSVDITSTVSGSTLTLSGTPVSENGVVVELQLTGFTASGYAPVTPVTPTEDKDDGLTITDYLLIVLVVLIVIMAVIVAMRLMRS